ncbi:hypothetical protein AK830_g4951 [Neonectria ditissima]|uniref:CSI2 protein n=1 Tax=Neonectria ditissima TaxID=78410 RepID=A0A0P7BMR3_9HYPO|nr:hypothetical protein AK830_g4951 [Neonectria ditissima]
MRPTNLVTGPARLLFSLAPISLFGSVAYAQNSDSSDSAATTDAAKTEDSKTEDSQTTTEEDSATQTTEEAQETTTEQDDSTTTTEKKATNTDEETTAEETSTSDEESATSTEDIQSTITSIASSGTESAITGMPTLTKVKAIPTYAAASVPPTENAPFMQHSSAPDGTVFIAVGAILGAFGIGILLWRVIVGFLLHRSVEQAAKAQHDANAKAGFPAPPAPFYKYTDNGSNMSISAGRGVRRTTRGPVLSAAPSQSNLFFSPTAAASGNPAGNRSSAFLPSGFYAAGNSSPGANQEHSISLTNLRPDSRGHFTNQSRHSLNPSPPDSPAFNARRDISNSTLNLNRPPSGRAPSAFLDDLLADDPSALPPPHMPGSSGGRHSSYGSGSPGPQNRF